MGKKSLLVVALLLAGFSCAWAAETCPFKLGVRSTEVAYWPFTDTLLDHCHSVLRRMARFSRLHSMETKSEKRRGSVVKPSNSQDHEKVSEAERQQCYECSACGYIYDPADGDGEFKKGTPFCRLPDYWVCPVCEVGKNAFELCE